MLRGMKLFICDECGKVFFGLDIEYGATVLSQPMKCPKCGSYHTYTSVFRKKMYKDVWKQMDKMTPEQEENQDGK